MVILAMGKGRLQLQAHPRTIFQTNLGAILSEILNIIFNLTLLLRHDGPTVWYAHEPSVSLAILNGNCIRHTAFDVGELVFVNYVEVFKVAIVC